MSRWPGMPVIREFAAPVAVAQQPAERDERYQRHGQRGGKGAGFGQGTDLACDVLARVHPMVAAHGPHIVMARMFDTRAMARDGLEHQAMAQTAGEPVEQDEREQHPGQGRSMRTQ